MRKRKSSGTMMSLLIIFLARSSILPLVAKPPEPGVLENGSPKRSPSTLHRSLSQVLPFLPEATGFFLPSALDSCFLASSSMRSWMTSSMSMPHLLFR